MCTYKTDEEAVLACFSYPQGSKFCQRKSTEYFLELGPFPNQLSHMQKNHWSCSYIVCEASKKLPNTNLWKGWKTLSCHGAMSSNPIFAFTPVSLWIIKSDSSSKEMVSITHSVAILAPTCCLEVKGKWGDFKQKLCWGFRQALSNFVSKFSVFTL